MAWICRSLDLEGKMKTTNLQWNLPTLTADCNTGSQWYVVNFKAVVTTSAPAGLLTNHEDIYDGSNVIVPETPYYYNGYNWLPSNHTCLYRVLLWPFL